MSLPDFLGLFDVPGLKPLRGQHRTWWALCTLWVGICLLVLGLGVAAVVGLLSA